METAVGMKYQKGRDYLSGKRVKMSYGQYLIYRNDQNGKEVRKQRNVRICPKANTPKWKASPCVYDRRVAHVCSGCCAEGVGGGRSAGAAGVFACGKAERGRSGPDSGCVRLL